MEIENESIQCIYKYDDYEMNYDCQIIIQTIKKKEKQ